MNAFQIRNIEVQAAFIIFPGIFGNIFNIWVYSRGITEKRSLLDSRHCNYTMTQQITYCSISRRPTSVDVVGMHQDALHILLSTCRTCSTEPIMNYHAPAIAAQEFPRPHIYLLCALEIFIRPSKRRKHDLYLDCPAPCGTSSTTTKGTLFGFKPRNLQNTGRLSKLAKASVLESDCSKCNFLKTHSTRNIKNMLTDFSTVLLLYRNHSIDLCS